MQSKLYRLKFKYLFSQNDLNKISREGLNDGGNRSQELNNLRNNNPRNDEGKQIINHFFLKYF